MLRSTDDARAGARGAGASPVVVRVGRRRAAWEAALEPGESLSSLVRMSVEAELERRQEVAELEEQRRAEGLPGILNRLDGLLEQAHGRNPQ